MEHHDVPRPVSPRPDALRTETTAADIAFDYTLTIDHCAEQYALAGHARTVRTIQRYCKNGALDARKVTTLTGDRFLVTPHSLRRHIEELNQLAAQTATIGQGWTAYDSSDVPMRQRRGPTPPIVVIEGATPEPARATENIAAHQPCERPMRHDPSRRPATTMPSRASNRPDRTRPVARRRSRARPTSHLKSHSCATRSRSRTSSLP